MRARCSLSLGRLLRTKLDEERELFYIEEAYMLNPNAKTFNPPTSGASGAASSAAAQMSRYNAVSTKERNTNTSVQNLTASLGDFGFVDEDDTDDLSALIHADGGEGGLDDGVDGGGGESRIQVTTTFSTAVSTTQK